MASNEAQHQANRSGMTPTRLVVIFTLFVAVALVLFLQHVIAPLWVAAGLPDRPLFEGLTEWKTTSLVALVVTTALLGGAWFNTRLRTLALETATELMKVTWPSRAETWVSTWAVVIASLVAGVLLFGIDTLAYKLMVQWLPALLGRL
jgi:preprotein translocase subunit SecE